MPSIVSAYRFCKLSIFFFVVVVVIIIIIAATVVIVDVQFGSKFSSAIRVQFGQLFTPHLYFVVVVAFFYLKFFELSFDYENAIEMVFGEMAERIKSKAE